MNRATLQFLIEVTRTLAPHNPYLQAALTRIEYSTLPQQVNEIAFDLALQAYGIDFSRVIDRAQEIWLKDLPIH